MLTDRGFMGTEIMKSPGALLIRQQVSGSSFCGGSAAAFVKEF